MKGIKYCNRVTCQEGHIQRRLQPQRGQQSHLEWHLPKELFGWVFGWFVKSLVPHSPYSKELLPPSPREGVVGVTKGLRPLNPAGSLRSCVTHWPGSKHRAECRSGLYARLTTWVDCAQSIGIWAPCDRQKPLSESAEQLFVLWYDMFLVNRKRLKRLSNMQI